MKTLHALSSIIALVMFIGIIALAFIGGELELISKETFLMLAKPMGIVCFPTGFTAYVLNEIK